MMHLKIYVPSDGLFVLQSIKLNETLHDFKSNK
jgi:hypothetical protein